MSDVSPDQLPRPSARRLWLIDDDPINHILCDAMFRNLDASLLIESFLDAESALVRLKQADDRPQLILLDLNMPGVSGWDFLERFAVSPCFQAGEIRIVILTSSVRNVDRTRAVLCPAVAEYCIKPLTQSDAARIWQALLASPAAAYAPACLPHIGSAELPEGCGL